MRASGEFARRRVALVGLQRSNAAVARFLAAQGAEVEAYDRKPAGELAEARALPAGGALFAGPEYLDHLSRRLPGLAAIFVTPGMPKDLPPLTAASAAGIPLWTEAAYVLEVFRGPVLAVTGSAGKTTTTTLVGEAVRRWRPGSLVGGNLGLPLLDRLHDVPAGAWLVLELSSFQLELARTSPRLAALLNVRPNHLDQHGSYEAYVDAKRRIYLHQGPEDVCIFGADDPEAMRLSAEAPGRRLWFSARGPVAAGVGLVDGTFRWYSGPGADGEPLLAASAVRLPGRHNLENVAAALALGRAAGVPTSTLAEVISGFRGVEHRLEPVRTWGGALWVNDSIATSPDRTLAALHTFAARQVVLLAGGKDKELPMEELGAAIARGCARVILFGAAAPKLEAVVRSEGGRQGRVPPLVRVADLAAAVHDAAAVVEPGQVVLLSPACASYDQFRDFEERGQRFRDLVAALPG